MRDLTGTLKILQAYLSVMIHISGLTRLNEFAVNKHERKKIWYIWWKFYRFKKSYVRKTKKRCKLAMFPSTSKPGLSNYKQRQPTLRSFITFHFFYYAVVWMFKSPLSKNCIKTIYELVLPIIYRNWTLIYYFI